MGFYYDGPGVDILSDLPEMYTKGDGVVYLEWGDKEFIADLSTPIGDAAYDAIRGV